MHFWDRGRPARISYVTGQRLSHQDFRAARGPSKELVAFRFGFGLGLGGLNFQAARRS